MTNKGKAAKLKPPKIDYPTANEGISAGHYAVRISAAQDEQVEICLDGGAWAPCFNSSGFWWFHLDGLAAGTHKLTARVKVSGETSLAMRKFEVKKPE